MMQAVTFVVATGLVVNGNTIISPFDKGIDRSQISIIKSELQHIRSRTLVIECKSYECVPITHGFNYLFDELRWPHSTDDPEAGIVSQDKRADGIVGLQLSPNDETTRAIKIAVEHATTQY
jgi:hypothetical protein